MTEDDDTTSGGADEPKIRLVREYGEPVKDDLPQLRRRNPRDPSGKQEEGAGRLRSQRANALRLTKYFLANGWSSEVRFNMMAEHIEARTPPWLVPDFLLDGVAPGSWRPLHDADLLEALVLVQEVFPSASVGNALEALRLLAHRGAVHPVRDYLAPLVWDGVARLHELFIRYFRARLPDDDPLQRDVHMGYLQQIAVCFGVGAVARVIQPGCKLDTAVVIIGDQNLGKSKGVRALCPLPDLFCDDLGQSFSDPDTKIGLATKWIIELAEAEQLLKNDIDTTKAFLSKQVDHFRLPYAHMPLDKKRQSIFFITANPGLEFEDTTGNRRFWPFECEGPVDVEAIEADRDMLWAEAVELYRNREQWWLNPEGEKIAAAEQTVFEAEPDPLIADIRPWVEGQEGSFTMADLLTQALDLATTDSRAVAIQRRVSKILRRELGCRRERPKAGPLRDQRIWRRDRV
jgi:predicted P-loop ATPase